MTNKKKAFKLFDEGKLVHDPEVRALGLKSKTRSNYYWEWEQRARGGQATNGSQVPSSKESIGVIDETKKIKKEVPVQQSQEPEQESQSENNKVEGNGEDDSSEEAKSGKSKVKEESVGELKESRGREDKKEKEGNSQNEVTIAGDGIRCIVYLSLQTLALYEIAAAKQARLSKNGEPKLALGDYLDSCSEQFFKDRNLKLGLVEI